MLKKKIFIFTSLLFLLVGVLAFYKYKSDHSQAILQAEVASDNNSKKSFIKIYSSGKIKKVHPSSDKYMIPAITVNPRIFKDHTDNKTNSTYLTINQKLLKQNKDVAADPTLTKIVKEITRESHHLIAILNLFKINGNYYVFIKYNASLSDNGTLYKYNNKKLIKICILDSGEIIRLQEIKNSH